VNVLSAGVVAVLVVAFNRTRMLYLPEVRLRSPAVQSSARAFAVKSRMKRRGNGNLLDSMVFARRWSVRYCNANDYRLTLKIAMKREFPCSGLADRD
jgi:hypothetical protein